MKKLLMIALVAIPVLGCETNELLQPPRQALLNGAARGDVSISIPDTIYGNNFEGRCDIPLTVFSFSPTQGEFTGGQIIFTSSTDSDTASINASQMADVVWPIPSSGGAFGTLTDDNFATHFAPPYTGTWKLDWDIGGSSYTATLNFLCLP